jgi:DNA-binding transcriptional regulator/RsmH inhibitor MraZ
VVIGIDSKQRMFLPDLWRQQTSSNVWIESVAPALPESANG